MASKKKVEIEASEELTEEVINAEVTEDVPAKAVVTGNFPLNIREGRTIESASLGLIPVGTEINILKVGKEWCKVNGGYVMKKFIMFP